MLRPLIRSENYFAIRSNLQDFVLQYRHRAETEVHELVARCVYSTLQTGISAGAFLVAPF